MKPLALLFALALGCFAQCLQPACQSPVQKGGLTAGCVYLPLVIPGAPDGARDVLTVYVGGDLSLYSDVDVEVIYEQNGERKRVRQNVPVEGNTATAVWSFRTPVRIVRYRVTPQGAVLEGSGQ